jgi:hypothetical protein
MIVRPALLATLCLGLAACGTPPTAEAAPPAPQPHLAAFADEAEFDRLLARWAKRAEELRRKREQERRAMAVAASAPPPPPAPPAPAAPAAMESAATSLDSVAVTGSRIAGAEESITNVQTAGVDEGGIVKRHGDHLVVLRRGRLFTVRIGGDQLQPVSMVDAYGPGTDPGGAWYDEMLVGGNTVVVVGFSYARGGTELVLFDIGRDGTLRYRDTYHLRSNDYYSARNYASRLIGDTLVFYTPMHVNPWNAAGREFMPAMRRWRADATPDDFRRILPAQRIYRTDDDLDPFDGGLSLHTVTRCDLAARVLDCTSTAVLGPAGRVFYVSADSVFVWTTQHGRDGGTNRSAVFRIPLDDAPPTALKTRGVPIDQLSFLHDGDHLNVLLTEAGRGEAMWGDDSATGSLALLRLPLASFGDGSGHAPRSAYRVLPGSADGDMQNRYVGGWLLYGNAPYRWRGSGDGRPGSVAYALRYGEDDAVHALALGHGTERIEAMGRHAIVVGSAGSDLHFTSVRLDDTRATTGSVYVQPDAAQGESRTHGFFYRGESEREGMVGLPIIGQRRGNTLQRYLDQSAAVLFLRNRDLRLTGMGRLSADADRAVDDQCKASCVDWYGNARPIFIGERVFALMGYEVVEGRVTNERIVERRRTNFAPALRISR